MRPRLVDWTLFTIVATAIFSGFASFLIGEPGGWWLFAAHGSLGLALLSVLVWKVRRVWPRLVEARRWDGATPGSVAALLAVGLVLLSGVVWATAQWPAHFPNGMWWHISLAVLLALFLLLHMAVRFKPLHRRDLRGRRTVLQLLGVAGSGLLLWAGNQEVNKLFTTAGDRRRFTGSRQEEGDFPVTMWMFDQPLPVNLTAWALQIRGAVANEQQFTYDQLAELGRDELQATLDCTSGWYTIQRWQGVSVGRLLDRCQPTHNAVAVSFQSITGYRWSLPLAEAHQVLLAAHVAGMPLVHGHGAPLRLVAPGHRGFQWVKWVTRVEVLTATDYGQWSEIFVSGLR